MIFEIRCQLACITGPHQATRRFPVVAVETKEAPPKRAATPHNPTSDSWCQHIRRNSLRYVSPKILVNNKTVCTLCVSIGSASTRSQPKSKLVWRHLRQRFPRRPLVILKPSSKKNDKIWQNELQTQTDPRKKELSSSCNFTPKI